MKPVFTAVVVIALATGYTSLAQNVVEYTKLPAKAPSPRTNLEASPTVSGTKPVVKPASQQKETQSNAQATSPLPPPPPAVFILSNGERVEATRYVLTVDSVLIQKEGAERSIPLSSINMTATLAANHARGVDLNIPKSSSQITLSF
jgi:hypothetical protein